jgi:hypothetical protein
MTSLTSLIERIEAATEGDKRILRRLDMSGECWVWTGPLDARGRGHVWRGGKLKLHHRAIWEILVGPIPPHSMLCHHCDNPTCANPAHIYLGDGKTNAADMFNRHRHWTQRDPIRAAQVCQLTGKSNTWARGSNNPKAKLTPSQVYEIRAEKRPSSIVAKAYGVDRTTIQRIRSGKLWKDAAILRARQTEAR